MRAAWVVIGVALVLASGCAQKDWIDRTLVTENVKGGWAGSLGGGGCYREVRLVLEQDGAKVTGLATFFGTGSAVPVAGASLSIQGEVTVGRMSRPVRAARPVEPRAAPAP